MKREITKASLFAVFVSALPVFAETTPTAVIGTWQSGIGEQTTANGDVA